MIFNNFSPNVYNASNILTLIMYFLSIFFKNDSKNESTIPSNIVSVSILWSFIIVVLVVYIELNKDVLVNNNYIKSFPIFSIDNSTHSLEPTLDIIHTYLFFILAISCFGLTSSILIIRNISRKIFCFISSISWIGVFHLFITSTPGFSFSLFMQPSMLLSLLSSQSIVFRSFLGESNKILNPTHLSSGVLFLIGINNYFDSILTMYNKLFGYNISSCTNNNDGVIPYRFDEMRKTVNINNIGFYYVFLFVLIISHISFNIVIYYLELEERKIPSDINENKLKTNKDNKKNINLNNNTIDINNMPDDCIEISTEDALLLVGGKKK
jgi:hypothetical protein